MRVMKEHEDYQELAAVRHVVKLLLSLGVVRCEYQTHGHYMTWNGECVTWLFTIEYKNERYF
jgi:hypothetical protein